MPTRSGQICKIVSDIPDMESDHIYIVVEDPVRPKEYPKFTKCKD